MDLLKITFDEMRIDPYNERILTLCRQYAKRFRTMLTDNPSLLFWGNVGTGKTYAAAGIANGVIQNGFSAEMLMFEDLLNYSDKGGVGLNAIRADLVIIDDLSFIPASRSALEEIYVFLQSRHREGKPMIFTTRLTPAQMRSVSDELGGKVFDFILTVCYQMQFTGKPRNIGYKKKCPTDSP